MDRGVRHRQRQPGRRRRLLSDRGVQPVTWAPLRRSTQLQFALGDRAGYGLFAQDWTGVSNPALLQALQAFQAPTTGPGPSPSMNVASAT